jgi:hypothetical protein
VRARYLPICTRGKSFAWSSRQVQRTEQKSASFPEFCCAPHGVAWIGLERTIPTVRARMTNEGAEQNVHARWPVSSARDLRIEINRHQVCYGDVEDDPDRRPHTAVTQLCGRRGCRRWVRVLGRERGWAKWRVGPKLRNPARHKFFSFLFYFLFQFPFISTILNLYELLIQI